MILLSELAEALKNAAESEGPSRCFCDKGRCTSWQVVPPDMAFSQNSILEILVDIELHARQKVGVTVGPMRGYELGFLSGEYKKEVVVSWGGANLAFSSPLSTGCGSTWREIVGAGSFLMARD